MKQEMFKFNESNHTYTLNGVIIPSVTQIMKPLTDEAYKSIPENTMKEAANRGTKVHLATEFLDKFNIEDIDENLINYLEAYKKFKADYDPIVLFTELPVYHKKFFYAGTIDRIYSINGKFVLVDIKTTNEIHKGLVAVQTTAYKQMITDMPIDSTAVLQLKADGTYEFINNLPDESKIFQSLLEIHHFKAKLGV